MAQHARQKVLTGKGGYERKHFLKIARQVSATVGNEFFCILVDHLGKALGTDCLYIGEFVGGQIERVRTLAARVDDRMEELEFPLAGSPDSEVAIGNPCLYARGVQELFPSDHRLAELHIESCVAIPLNNSDGQTSGVMAALYRRPLGEEVWFVQSMLTIFAARVAAELSRKQADDALRETEQRHRAFIMMNTDAMWRVEFDKPISTDVPEEEQLKNIYDYGYVAECNDALAHLAGLRSADQLIGVRIADLVPQAEVTMRTATLALIRSGYRYSTIETPPIDGAGDRRYLWRTHWGIVENGVLLRIWGCTRDITELRRYQMGLMSSERRLTELLESVHLVAIMLDDEGAITFCNNFLLDLTGWHAEDIAGKNWFDLMIAPEEREKVRAAFLSATATSQAPPQFECPILTRKGSTRLIEWDSVILRDAEGKIAGSASIGRDITEHRALEAQFRQSQKLESLGRLAGGLAHDFNNLLTVIRGYSTLLLENRANSDPAYEGLREIKKVAEKAAVLTNQLLSFSRHQKIQHELLNLNEVLAEVEPMLRRLIGEDIELTVNQDPNLGLVRADASHLHQVLMNLAVNARDAMPRGGKLMVALSNVDLTEKRPPKLAGIAPGRYVQLIVADTGIGMSEEVQAHLFEPFFTTKEPHKGTGLGLSTVYGIVQQIHGHIVVETMENKGTTFEMLLPRAVAEASSPVMEANAAPTIRGGTETILLVEDQHDLRRLLGTLLRRLGYTVLEADSGLKALRLVKRHRGPIHLMVTDVVMPGMSGPELADRVITARTETKVLYISGYDDTRDIRQPLDNIRSAYLQKSFAPEILGAKVRELLDQ
jgi:two-component system, cell cycle sensor histidine kinase and response regulator CckA